MRLAKISGFPVTYTLLEVLDKPGQTPTRIFLRHNANSKSHDDPITEWIHPLEQSDDSAARGLWNHYCCRLTAMAQQKLHPDTRRVYDGEDAAISAFGSLCRRVSEGRFPELKDRDDRWRVLMVITCRKVCLGHRHDRQEKRDIHLVRGNSIFVEPREGSRAGKRHALVSRGPTPEFAAEVAATCEALYSQLKDETLRSVAALKLQGYSNPQIARQLDCSPRTVERKLERSRRQWGREDLG